MSRALALDMSKRDFPYKRARGCSMSSPSAIQATGGENAIVYRVEQRVRRCPWTDWPASLFEHSTCAAAALAILLATQCSTQAATDRRVEGHRHPSSRAPPCTQSFPPNSNVCEGTLPHIRVGLGRCRCTARGRFDFYELQRKPMSASACCIHTGS